jgi:hypothetical protein
MEWGFIWGWGRGLTLYNERFLFLGFCLFLGLVWIES